MSNTIWSHIEKAQSGGTRARIALGLDPGGGRLPGSFRAALAKAAELADLTIVGRNVTGLGCIRVPDRADASKALVAILKEGQVDGIVRGQLPKNLVDEAFCAAFSARLYPCQGA